MKSYADVGSISIIDVDELSTAITDYGEDTARLIFCCIVHTINR